MYNQIISGTPGRCCNRLCKTPFTKSSHCGYLPKNEAEVYVIMKCHACNDKFKIVQQIVQASDYKDKLPSDIVEKNDSKISLQEIDDVRQLMETSNPLETLKK